MVDCIKIQVYERAVIDYFYNHALLEWLGEEEKLHHFHNDEIVTKVRKQFRGIVFCFYNDKLDIIFKPHYYFNNNLHNANDFSVSNCIKVVEEFGIQLDIDLLQLPVVNLEFGVNLLPPFYAKDIITYTYSHGRNEFRTDAGLQYSKKSGTFNNRGRINTFKMFKMYGKGIQYPEYCHQDTIRFEQKSKRSKRLNGIPVATMADLLKSETYQFIRKSIENEFKKVIILDAITDYSILDDSDRKKYEKYLNPNNWYRYQQQSRNVFSNNVKNFERIQSKVPGNMKTVLTELLRCKLNELSDMESVQMPH